MFVLHGYHPLDTCDYKKHADHASEERLRVMQWRGSLPSPRVPEGAAVEIPSQVFPRRREDAHGLRRATVSTVNLISRRSKDVPGGLKLI